MKTSRGTIPHGITFHVLAGQHVGCLNYSDRDATVSIFFAMAEDLVHSQLYDASCVVPRWAQYLHGQYVGDASLILHASLYIHGTREIVECSPYPLFNMELRNAKDHPKPRHTAGARSNT